MFGFRRRRGGNRSWGRGNLLIETLEPRELLSASASEVLRSDAIILHPAASSSDIQGYTPAQIRHAYGIDQIAFANSTLPADGRGQTIAIVDSNNDPNIVSDLSVFDSQFGLSAPPSFRIVSQSGGAALPSTDAGWAGEISLDVEWAHAIGPQANLLLVEANSPTVQDLMAAVDYARHAPGVSAVSMSWGGSEFFSWNGSEFTGQTQYDPYFTTPAGHSGVTFVAAAGDSGAFSGVEWPASSPNVLSVGGTSLYVQDQAGTYSTESSWNGTSGGFSQIEPTPSWQQAVQNSGARATPDVAFDGDPNTGFAVYDSLPDQGYSGWQEVGGTSAGAPQWAALVAIADEGRASAGRGALDGATQTLPILYSLYDYPGTSGYSSYASYFNDVVDSMPNNPWHWRWGGLGYGNPATAGYDTATGLGTPVANQIVAALTGAPSSTSGSTGGNTSGGGGGTTTPAALPASPLTGAFVSAPPAAVLEGQNGSLRLRLTNTASSRFSGPLTISLYASTDGTVSADSTFVTSITIAQLSLRAGASKVVRLRFNYPSGLSDGSYILVASINAVGTGTAPALASESAPVTIAPATVDLAVTFAGNTPVAVHPGHATDATVEVQNLGNVPAQGTVALNLYASASPALDASAQLLVSIPARKINLRPGRSMLLHVHFTAPANQPGGSYYLLTSITSATQPGDNNPANDAAVTATS